jgi:hypothetical protein
LWPLFLELALGMAVGLVATAMAAKVSDDAAAANTAETDGSEKPIDRTQVDLLLARSWAGTGDFEEAAAIAGGLIGFDLTKKTFDPKRKAAAGSTEAFILLAAILEEKFKDPTTANAVLEQLVTVNAKDSKAWLALASWHRQRGNPIVHTLPYRGTEPTLECILADRTSQCRGNIIPLLHAIFHNVISDNLTRCRLNRFHCFVVNLKKFHRCASNPLHRAVASCVWGTLNNKIT